MTTRPDAADLFALTDEEDDPPMTNPSPYPATREYDIDVDVTVRLTIREELVVNDPRADADAYVRDDLITQIKQSLKQIHADVDDIEWTVTDVRTP